MTSYTTPDQLPIPQATDTVAALEDKFGDLANAMQAALLRPSSVASATARNSAIPNPTSGQRVWRSDLNIEETYLSTAVVRTAGWYPTAGAMPQARLYRSTDLNVASGGAASPTTVTWVLDTTSRSFTQNGTSIVVPAYSGRYGISGVAYWASSATGYRSVKLTTTGTGAFNSNISLSQAPGAGFYQDFYKTIYLEAGSQVQLAVGQNSGATLSLLASDSEFVLTYLGPA